MQKILLVEDDIWIWNSLKLYLENSNFEVELHQTWAFVMEKVNSFSPDLMILDINLPEKNWIEICKELRNVSNLPVIMLTAKTSELDKINWLEIGADDYIPKPFSPRELLARINSILRRTKPNNLENSEKLVWRNISINKTERVIQKDQKEIVLTKNEFDLIVKLFEANWKLVSREVLMTEVMWYDNYIYDRTLDTHIKNLRKKLDLKDVIITIRWEWYKIKI